MSNWDQIGFTPQGWQCPVCKRVYSPSYPWCLFCGNEDIVTTDNITISNDYQSIVRCDQCKHAASATLERKGDDFVQKSVFCNKHGEQKPDWFCADGEKRK